MISLFGSAAPPAFTPLSISGDTLAGWYGAKSFAAAARAAGPQLSGASSGQADTAAAPPPWDPAAKSPSEAEALRKVLADGRFVDMKDLGRFSDIAAPEDHKKLFALHEGVKKLYAIAAEASEKTTTQARRDFLDRRLQEGLAQIAAFVGEAKFDAITVFGGQDRDKAQSGFVLPNASDNVTTGVLHDGAFDDEVAAFTGALQFAITVKNASGAETVVDIDLDDMGAAPRTLDNVAAHINAALQAAGAATRFARVKLGAPDENGVVAGTRFGFEIRRSPAETLSFSAPDARPALFLGGSSGGATQETGPVAGQLSKIVDLDAGSPATAFVSRIEAEGAGLRIAKLERAPDGGFVALAETEGAVSDALAPKGAKDLLLLRYDSTGRQLWARALGAAEEAQGLALAVSAAGDIAVGGAISGAFGDTTARGGTDAVVAVFDENGAERWAQRFGSALDDAVEALAFAADGALYAAGRAKGSVAGGAFGGGTDAVLRAFDVDGDALWTRQWGAAGDEKATALTVADDGGVIVGSVEAGAGVLAKFDPANGTDPALWTHDLGDLDSGSIAALRYDGGALYAAGAARSAFSPPSPLVAHAGARDAFLLKLTDGPAPTHDYATFLGSDAEDVASGLAVYGGKVYLSGRADAALPGAAEFSGARAAFAAGFDAATGVHEWTVHVPGRGGRSEAAAIAVDPTGASALDRLGLPHGALTTDDTTLVAARSPARAGDHFFISVAGGHKRKITLEAGDTLRGLAFKINATLLLSGEASVARVPGGSALHVAPKAGVSVELIAGGAGQDLLAALGLAPGLVAKAETGATSGRYALDLARPFDVLSQEGAVAARDAFDAAMSQLRRAHRDLTRPKVEVELTADGRPRKTGGQAPAHLLAKIGAYQDALARLGG